ncbi:MAG: ComEC/Rec2 family competence protein [Planctomycetota bacterium]
MPASNRDRDQRLGTKTRLSRRLPLLPLAGAAMIGVSLAAYGWIDSTLAYWIAGAAALTAFIDQKRHRYAVVRRTNAFPWLVVCLTICVFGIRYNAVWNSRAAADLSAYLTAPSQPTVLSGYVAEPVRWQRNPLEAFDPEQLNDSRSLAEKPSGEAASILVVGVETIQRGRRDVSTEGRVMVMADHQIADLWPGDRVRIFGQIRRFEPPSNPGERDRRDWARRRDVHAIIHVRGEDMIEGIPSTIKPGLWLSRSMARIASSGRETLLNAIDPERSGLALALILGQRDLLDHETNQQLLVTGTAHLLSVSGLHLAIIVMLARVVVCALGVSPQRQVVILILVAVFYALLTGGRPPVLRAFILVSAVLVSILLSKRYSPTNSLAMAGLLLLYAVPLEAFAVGMQLSFIAVATLLACGNGPRRARSAADEAKQIEDQIDALIHSSRSHWHMRCMWVTKRFSRMLWYSASVTALTLPAVWWHFHVISPISVVVNVLLGPLMTVALSAGVLTVLLGWMHPIAAIPFGWLCEKTLTCMHWMVQQAAGVPGGHFWLPQPALHWVLLFYVMVALILLLRPKGKRWYLVACLAFVWTGLAGHASTRPKLLARNTLELTFLDVGHGTATLIRCQSDSSKAPETWLYDCGWLGNQHGHCRVVDTALWAAGVRELDGVILSHADVDHYNALASLCGKFDVQCVVVPPGMLNKPSGSLHDLVTTLSEHEIPVYETHAGQTLSMANPWRHGEPIARHLAAGQSATWLVRHPPESGVQGNDNANSLVLQIQHGGRCIVLPGDLEPPGTQALTQQPRCPPGSILMAPHHGSLHMQADQVLQWARPTLVLVSGGQRAARPEVASLLSQYGSRVEVTAQVGAIRVRVDGSGSLQVDTFRNRPW